MNFPTYLHWATALHNFIKHYTRMIRFFAGCSPINRETSCNMPSQWHRPMRLCLLLLATGVMHKQMSSFAKLSSPMTTHSTFRGRFTGSSSHHIPALRVCLLNRFQASGLKSSALRVYGNVYPRRVNVPDMTLFCRSVLASACSTSTTDISSLNSDLLHNEF